MGRPRVTGGKGTGKAKNETWKGGWVFLMVPNIRVGRPWDGSKWSMKNGLGASWFPRRGFGRVCGRRKMKHEKRCWVLHGSQVWGGKGLGRFKMVPKSVVGMVWEGKKWRMKKVLRASWFPRVRWEGLGNAKNEAWKGVWVLHDSQDWGGKGLGRLKMKHEKRFGCFSWFPTLGWGGKGLGRFKMKFPRVLWVLHGLESPKKEGSWKNAEIEEWKGGLGASWLPRVGWEELGNAKMKHEKGFGCFMAPKSGVGRVWEGLKNEAWKGVWVFLMVPKNNV